MNIVDEDNKRTFIEFTRKDDGTLEKVGKYKGNGPSQAARKAIMKESRLTGKLKEINVILYEPGKLNRHGREQIRFYTGFIKNEEVIDPKMGEHQRKSAIERESWVLDEQGNPQTVFDDGYDSSQDPVLKGRRPIYIAKRAVSSWHGVEELPLDDKRIFVEFKRKDDGSLEEVDKYKGNVPSQAACKAIMKVFKVSGKIDNIDIILHEPGKVNKNGKEQIRLYTGHIKDIGIIDPKMGKDQRKSAIERESWVLDEQGNPQTVFDDGYDSSQDPVLKGRRPVYMVKRAVSSYCGMEEMPIKIKERKIK